MTPTVGRIVHYQSFGTPGGEYLPEPRAAIITTVTSAGGHKVGLAVLNPSGLFFNDAVPFSETPKPGHWNWPPRGHVAIQGDTVSIIGGNPVHSVKGLVGHARPPLGVPGSIPAVFPNAEVH